MIKGLSLHPKKKITTHQQTKISEYKIEGTLGQGAYGKVKWAIHKASNEKVAIKFVEKNKLIRAGDAERMQTEMKIITSLDHPNILKAYEIFEDEKFYYIVMEKPGKGDLFNYICNKHRLTINEATYIYYQIVNAIDYLHRNNIVHRDMKPENVMLTDDMIVKLGDFGLSTYFKNLDSKLGTNCGSPCYSAPEMLKGNLYKPAPIDIWGIGIIFYCMICGQLPFEDDNEDTLYRKVVRCEFTCPYFINSNLKLLFKKFFTENPNKRITMDEIKNNAIYNMGKANFIKEFKIYGDDGDLLDIVKKYIKEKSLKSIQTECAMEINSNSENTTSYKIFFYKYMHKTPWNEYYIPNCNNENKENEEIKHFSNRNYNEENINILKKNDNGNNRSKSPKINFGFHNKFIFENHNNSKINIEEEKNLDILAIPKHNNFSNCFAMTFDIPKTKNKNKDEVNSIMKLGILNLDFNNNKSEKKAINQKHNKINITKSSLNGSFMETPKKAITRRNKNNSVDKNMTYEQGIKKGYFKSGRKIPFKI